MWRSKALYWLSMGFHHLALESHKLTRILTAASDWLLDKGMDVAHRTYRKRLENEYRKRLP